MTPGASRGIRIPGFEPHAANDDEGLPVIGRVAAGAPILAEQNIEESCRINPAFFNPRADYLLRVRGMSMKDIGILDGDLLAVHVTREAQRPGGGRADRRGGHGETLQARRQQGLAAGGKP